MPVRFEEHITRDMLRREPDTLFVFGDNIVRKGVANGAGLAQEMRGEPNAVGIPTKRIPSNVPGAFFTDDDLSLYHAHSHSDWLRIKFQLKQGKTVVFPKDGIGTGRADLPRRAPKLYADIQEQIESLHKIKAVRKC